MKPTIIEPGPEADAALEAVKDQGKPDKPEPDRTRELRLRRNLEGVGFRSIADALELAEDE